MHTLRCQCGTVQGHIVDGGPSNRVRCYCFDCQAFARFLNADAQILDSHGGTEIVQIAQARLRVVEGLDRIASIRLSDKGMIRWYASCCNTPIGNTMPNLGVSFIGLIHSCLDHSNIDRDFGTYTALVNTGTAVGEPKPKQRGLIRTIAKFAQIISTTRLFARYKGSPLFTGFDTPISTPRVLSPTELRQLQSEARPPPGDAA